MEQKRVQPLTDSEKENIERKAAETILECGVRIPIPAPCFLRLFGKKEIQIKIKQPYLRTLHTAAALALKEGFSFDKLDSGNLDAANEVIVKHAPSVAKWIAIHVLNNRVKNRLFAGLLGSWLMSRLNQKRILEIVSLIIIMDGYQDFTHSIRLIRSLRLTAPKNLSPQNQGSQEAEQSV